MKRRAKSMVPFETFRGDPTASTEDRGIVTRLRRLARRGGAIAVILASPLLMSHAAAQAEGATIYFGDPRGYNPTKQIESALKALAADLAPADASILSVQFGPLPTGPTIQLPKREPRRVEQPTYVPDNTRNQSDAGKRPNNVNPVNVGTPKNLPAAVRWFRKRADIALIDLKKHPWLLKVLDLKRPVFHKFDPVLKKLDLRILKAFQSAVDPAKRLMKQIYNVKLNAMGKYGSEAQALFDTAALEAFMNKQPVAFNNLKSVMPAAFAHALHFARQDRLGLSAVRFVGPEEWENLDQPAFKHLVSSKYGMPLEAADKTLVFPIKINDEWLLWLPKEPQGTSEGFSIDENDFQQSVGPDADFVPRPLQPLTNTTGNSAGLATNLIDTTPLNKPDADSEPNPNRRRSRAGVCGPSPRVPCFMPAVSLHNRGNVVCSGVLLAPDWVASAAHCFCAPHPTRASIGMVTPDEDGTAAPPTATVGVTRDVYFFGETPDSKNTNKFCARFAEWKKTPRSAPDWPTINAKAFGERDLALVRLRQPLFVESFQSTALIGSQSADRKPVRFYVAGFGKNDLQARGGRKTYIGKDLDRRDCSDPRYAAKSGCQPRIEFTVLHSDKHTDSCAGDSGAGVYVRRNDARLIAIGVVSRGLNSGPCGSGGIYSNLTDSEALRWIETVVPSVEISPVGENIETEFLLSEAKLMERSEQ